MLAREENDLLTLVGPDTPMGNTMRRYWIPALLAWELPEPDCPPVRVKLLGEDLVAFRDTRGRIGLLGEYCPHRRASLFFGRNEECGLRCVYHGWKFDIDGRCVDMMNEPEELAFKNKIHTTSYPVVEVGGILWTYMGPPDLQPPLPLFAWTQAPPTHRHVSKVIQIGPGSSRRTPSYAGRRPPSWSISRTTAIDTPASVRSMKRTCTSARTTSSCRSIRSAPLGLNWAVPPKSRATSGSRWMTKAPWCTTGWPAPGMSR